MSSIPHLEPIVKPCSKCGELKPITAYYVKIPATGRLFSWCKPCHNALVCERAKASPEKARAQSAKWRAANLEKAREVEANSRARNIDRIRERNRLRDQNRKEAKAEWRKANAEKRKAYNQAWRETNAEKYKAGNAAYYADNKDIITVRVRKSHEAKPEKYAAMSSEWKKANKSKVVSYGHKRRAKLVNAGNYTAAEWEALKISFDNRCLMCNRQEPEIKLTVDHVIPVALGGSNDISNLQPLCKSCNSKKHAKILDLRKEEN